MSSDPTLSEGTPAAHTPPDVVRPSREDFRQIDILTDLTDDDLDWLAARTDLRVCPDGETFVRAGTPAEHLHFMFEGQLDYAGELGGQPVHWVVRSGEVAGLLPRSRMTHFPSTAVAVGLARVGRLHRDHFADLAQAIPSLDARLLAVMTNRIRDAAHAEEQRERMSALGKLAAGLAHELNNPVAATRRAASDLRERLGALPDVLERWLSCTPDPALLRRVEQIVRTATTRASDPLSPLSRSELEDDLADRLADLGAARPEERAATLVEGGLRPEDLDLLGGAGSVGASETLDYLEFRLASTALLLDMERAGSRVSDLVTSIKRYSHMDRGGDRLPTDVRQGLDSTVTMLGHKLRSSGVQVRREYDADVPMVSASEGALNQVWTNLIDNAADALGTRPDRRGGTVTLRVTSRGESVIVRVIDDGPGIPTEVQGRIFEPFFTTKGVGEGTGLGLDLVQRVVMRQHGGAVRLSSQPGHTEFMVLLPALSAATPDPAHPDAATPAAPPEVPQS